MEELADPGDAIGHKALREFGNGTVLHVSRARYHRAWSSRTLACVSTAADFDLVNSTLYMSTLV